MALALRSTTRPVARRTARPALRSLSGPRHQFVIGGSTFRLYLGDCVPVMGRLAPHSVDAIVTSPPYNLGIKYRTYDDDMPRAEYLGWTDQWLRAASRLSGPEGSLFLNVGAKPTDPWIPLEVAQVARRYYKLQNTIHWVKSIAIDKESTSDASGIDRDLAVGHYKPINSDRFVNDCHEYIFHLTPAGTTKLDRRAVGVPYQDKSNAARWATGGDGKRCRGNTWFIPYETIQSRDRDRPHPACFPPKVPEQCLRLHGVDRVKTVLDPFLGLGNTAIAAGRLGLDFIGIELDEHYLEEAVARVREALT
ncbi:MAG: site-specific DNA-methyltransferase [Acidimicrobiia bacterium]|nr:site-specific DNA-methyltransferase [Acidimicrobiia bacterium]